MGYSWMACWGGGGIFCIINWMWVGGLGPLRLKDCAWAVDVDIYSLFIDMTDPCACPTSTAYLTDNPGGDIKFYL